MTGPVHILHVPRWHPARINDWDGRHWSKRHTLKKADRQMVEAYALQAKIPKATGKRRVTLIIVLAPRRRGGDPDSYTKSLADALVHAKLLRDDNRQHVELAPVQYERGTADDWGTIIRLEDL